MRLLASILPVFMTSLLPAAGLRVHAPNPRYLEWRGRPAVLIGSGEHYGALVNLDFDFARYFATLQKDGLNVTRVFSGACYVEPQGAFHIEGNTLAPAKGRYLAPWARSTQPGAWDGGNRWNLEGWNEDYFTRLRELVSAADKAGVVVEFNFFCPFYADKENKTKSLMWPLSPFHPANRTTDIGDTPHDKLYSLEADPRALAAQERFVRRVVAELKDAGNVYYEVCNEPYFGGVTMDWQHRIIDLIEDAQGAHEAKKVISLNIANRSARIERPHPAVGLFNFHYTYPPIAVAENWALNKAMGNNETGFRGQKDEVYRNEAWDWLLAGGATFNHLDYSFIAGHEDGAFVYPDTQPGGGTPALRSQLGVLKRFMESLDFVHLKPSNDLVSGLGAGASIQLLAQPGKQYAGYLHHSGKKSKELNRGRWQDTFTIRAAEGSYRVEWIDPVSGRVLEEAAISKLDLKTPVYETEIALKITSMQ